MPIRAATVHAAARILKNHLNDLLAHTITETPLVVFSVGKRSGRVNVAFRQAGKPRQVPLRTRFGPMLLHLSQTCEGMPIGRRSYQLQTIRYRYSLTAEDAEEPIVRWEYERTPQDDATWCRHHLQGDLSLPAPLSISLNELHVPTGYTLVEEVIRFCIHDLRVRPRSDDWHRRLLASEETFKRDFAPPTDRR